MPTCKKAPAGVRMKALWADKRAKQGSSEIGGGILARTEIKLLFLLAVGLLTTASSW